MVRVMSGAKNRVVMLAIVDWGSLRVGDPAVDVRVVVGERSASSVRRAPGGDELTCPVQVSAQRLAVRRKSLRTLRVSVASNRRR